MRYLEQANSEKEKADRGYQGLGKRGVRIDRRVSVGIMKPASDIYDRCSLTQDMITN